MITCETRSIYPVWSELLVHYKLSQIEGLVRMSLQAGTDHPAQVYKGRMSRGIPIVVVGVETHIRLNSKCG